MKKRCLTCKQPFQARRSNARFCAPRGTCRMAYYREQIAARQALATDLARHDWHSPPEVVEAARRVMGGIDLDPASCEEAN